MTKTLSGLKIRVLRKQRALTQAELARRAGISASYLNLIEANRRPVTAAVLERLAAGLNTGRETLDGQAEKRRVDDLNEIAVDPAIGAAALPPHGAEELVGRLPDWAGLLLRLYSVYRDRNEAVLALADRLNRDPFLADSVHRMLTSVTAIRAAAEILTDEERLDLPSRRRFLDIIASDSARLSDTAQALVDFFGSAHQRVRSATPMESVDAFIAETDNFFPDLEALAAGLGHGDGPPGGGAGFRDPSSRFALVKETVHGTAGDPIARIVQNHPALGSETARTLAAAALESYVAGAILMPYDAFLLAARESRYDIDALMRRFGVSYEQAAHRLATLRRPGAEGVRFAYMRSDPSGYVTKRLPLAALPLPRYGTACPLWAVYAAFQSPGVTVRHYGQLPSGESFLFFARAVDKSTPAIGRPRNLQSIMLVCQAAEADATVYGDGIDRNSATLAVGTVCRLCPRQDCSHRQEAPLIG